MSIKINLVTDYVGAGLQTAIKEFKQLETTSQKAQFAIRKAAIPAAAALTGLAAGFKSAVAAGSDLAESQSKVNVIFGDGAKEVEDFSKQAAKSMGQSRRAVLQAAGTFGTFGKAAGLGGKDLAKFSNNFTKLAGDLASFNNTTPEDAVQAIGAALRGEAEPMRRFGVLLNDATLKAEALALGIYDGSGALTDQQKILAAQSAIYKQTTDAQGDFLRTSDGLANSQRILSASLDDIKSSIGEALLPVVEAVLPPLKDFAEWARNNPTIFKNVALAIGAIAAATVALNIASAANPYVVAAAGVVALAAGYDQLYKKLDNMNKLGGNAARLVGLLFGGPAAIPGLLKVQKGILGLFGVTSKATDSMAGLNKAQIENAEINALVASGLITLTNNENNFTETTGAGNKELDTRLAKIKELRKEMSGNFKSALDRAKSVLGDAQKAFSDFAKSVSDSITSSFSFKSAQEAGAETGRGFLAALTDQVAKTRDFAVKINRLLAAGLSEGALQQVLAAGQEAGGAIADELLNGGAAAIAQANALTAEVASLGTNVGQNAAVQFRQAGVDAGTAMVAGITEAISKFQVKLRSKKLTPKQLARLQKDFGVSVDFLLSGGQASIPALADGGIVKASPGGTLALIGEGGRDEAVIPLDRMGSMGGGDVNIYVQGADPNAVVDALRTYMFRNGSVPIRVS